MDLSLGTFGMESEQECPSKYTNVDVVQQYLEDCRFFLPIL